MGDECQRCGCEDLEPVGSVDSFTGVTRMMQCRHCGHGQAEGTRPPRGAVVDYVPLRCPYCASLRVVVTGTSRPLRYHRCRDCQGTFQSVEKVGAA
jgi:hypothetical protein